MNRLVLALDTGVTVSPAELVVVPLAVNLASSGITAIVRRLIAGLSPAQPDQSELDITEMTSANGDRVIVVRSRRTPW